MDVDIFVSYSSKDRNSAGFADLLGDLASLDRAVWYDRRLQGGQEWWDEILAGIAGCRLFIVALTEHYAHSVACQRELYWAMQTRRRVLPVALEAVSTPDVPEPLRIMQIIDYADRSAPEAGANCVARLALAIEASRTEPRAPLPQPLPQQPEIPPAFVQPILRYLSAPEPMSVHDQDEMLQATRSLVNEDDDDRTALREAVRDLLGRRDIAWQIRENLDQISTSLETTTEPAPESRPTGAPPGRILSSMIHAPGLDMRKLTEQLRVWLESQGMKVDVVRESGGTYVVNCSSAKRRASFTGAGASIEIRLKRVNDDLHIDMANPQWADKATSFGAGVAATLLTGGWAIPAVVPSVIGTYRQAMLPRRVFAYLERMAPTCIV